MSTSESSRQRSLHPNEPYSVTARFVKIGLGIGCAGALTLRAFVVGTLGFVGLLVCPPLFILVVVVVVPLVALTVLVCLIAAVLATPYRIVRHARGHRGGHAVLRHRLGHALHALLDIAPHRLLAAIRHEPGS